MATLTVTLAYGVSINGRTSWVVTFNPETDTIEDLQRQIYANGCLPPEQQRWILEGPDGKLYRQLSPRMLAADCGLCNGSCIALVFRLKGAVFTPHF